MNNKKVAITQQLNKETKQLENTRRFIQTYKNNMIEQGIQYSWDKDEKKWYKNYEQNFFYNENKKLIRQQAFLMMVQEYSLHISLIKMEIILRF